MRTYDSLLNEPGGAEAAELRHGADHLATQQVVVARGLLPSACEEGLRDNPDNEANGDQCPKCRQHNRLRGHGRVQIFLLRSLRLAFLRLCSHIPDEVTILPVDFLLRQCAACPRPFCQDLCITNGCVRLMKFDAMLQASRLTHLRDILFVFVHINLFQVSLWTPFREHLYAHISMQSNVRVSRTEAFAVSRAWFTWIASVERGFSPPRSDMANATRPCGMVLGSSGAEKQSADRVAVASIFYSDSLSLCDPCGARREGDDGALIYNVRTVNLPNLNPVTDRPTVNTCQAIRLYAQKFSSRLKAGAAKSHA